MRGAESSATATAVPAVVPAVAQRRPMRPDRAAIVAILIILIGSLIVAWEARHSTFTGDDWAFILQRRGTSAGVFLRPHNEHLSAIPILIYKLLLAVFGAGSYVPFMAVLLVTHFIVCILLYAVARRYLGPWLALIPAAVTVVLGPAWQDLLWAFQIGYLGSVAAGLGMILCLERRTATGDRGAAVLLSVSLLCSSVGLVMIPLAAVLIALQHPLAARRLWAVAVPVALYLVWYAFDGVNTIRTSDIPGIPRYVFNALSAAVGSATGLGQTHQSPYLVATTPGRYVAVIAVLALLVTVVVRRGRLPALTWATLISVIALWIAEAIEYFPGGREAAQSRYQYTSVVLVLLVAASVCGDRRSPGANRRRRIPAWALASVGTLALLVCASNVAILHNRIGFWSTNSAYDRAEEGALQISAGVVSPSFQPDNAFTVALVGEHNISVITAGPYFSASRAFGSVGYSPAQIGAAPEPVREAADVVLVFAERLRLTPAAAPSSSCRLSPVAGELTVSPGQTLTLRGAGSAPARILLRRFGSRYRFPPLAVAAGATATLTFAHDRATAPWHVRATTAAARLCVS